MGAVLAKAAGVSRTVVCSPPLPDGGLNPLVAAAAELCEVDEVYKVGGAQAIAAMAYGTESIEPVDKIIGPGGPYVLAAKQIVSSDIAIDLPAGPTELLVVAFGRFDEEFVARDLVAQAEHSPWSVCGVVTDSASNARCIISALSKILAEGTGREMARKALDRSFFVCTTKNLKDAAEFANAFAPEHVQLMGSAQKIAKDMKTFGLLLVGDYSPSAVSDYSAGSNHILPTGGLARSYSGLSAWDFMRRAEIISCTRKGLRSIAQPAILLARAEGLENHALAALERLKN
jgi:histidinol dehydrogenase